MEFKKREGLRQDNPLTPFLFFLLAKGLGGLVLNVEAKGILLGYKVGRRV